LSNLVAENVKEHAETQLPCTMRNSFLLIKKRFKSRKKKMNCADRLELEIV